MIIFANVYTVVKYIKSFIIMDEHNSQELDFDLF